MKQLMNKDNNTLNTKNPEVSYLNDSENLQF